VPEEVWVLGQDEELGSQSRSRDGGRDHGEPVERIERVACPAPQKEKEPEPHEIGEDLEDGVNRDQNRLRKRPK
jgi:hypothetical protein